MKAQAAPLPAAAVARSLRSGGQPLDQRLRARLTASLGTAAAIPLRDARVHLDADADLAARMMDADAVTQGRHILFRAGAFAPDAADGWALLVHEAAHVVQAAGSGPAPEAAPIDRTATAELEADAALASGTVRPLGLAAPALRATSARADPARLAQEVADSLVARFGADAADTSGRIRQQLIAMAEPFRRDVLRAMQRRLGDGAWARFLEVIAAPLPPAGLDSTSESGPAPEVQSSGEAEEATPGTPPETATPVQEPVAADEDIVPLEQPHQVEEDGPTSAMEPAEPDPADTVPEDAEHGGGGMGPDPAVPSPAAGDSITPVQEAPSPPAVIAAPPPASSAAAQTEAAPLPGGAEMSDAIEPIGGAADADIAPLAAPAPVEALPDSEIVPPSDPDTLQGDDAEADTTPPLEEPAAESLLQAPDALPASQGATTMPPAVPVAIPADILGEFASEPAEDGGAEGGGAFVPSGGGSGGAAPVDPPAAPVVAATAEDALTAAATHPVTQIGGAVAAARSAAGSELAGAAASLAAEPPTLARPAVTAPPRPVPVDQPISRTRPAVRSGAVEPISPASVAAPGAPVQVATPAIAGQGDGTLAAQDVARVRQAVGSVAVTDPGLRLPAGPPPPLRLVGAADPAGAGDAQAALLADRRAAAAAGRVANAAPMGEDAIRAERPAEVLVAPIVAVQPGPAQGTAVDPANRAEAIIAEEQGGEGVRSAAQAAAGRITGAREQRSAETAARRSDGTGAIDQAIAADAAEQDRLRLDAGRDVAARRGAWRDAEGQALDAAQSEGAGLDSAAQADVAGHAAGAREGAAGHLSAGEARTEELAQEAEGRARARRAEAAREAEGGVLGWLASAITSFFARLRDALHALFDAARAAVTRVIAEAQRLAAAVIAAARDWIVARIRAAADAILAVADRLLATLPGLRDRFRALITGLVDAAVAAVNRLAEALTRALQALLAALGTTLRAILSAYELVYGAIIDAVAAVVNGALAVARTVVAGFGIFAALVGDIAPAPAAWLAKLGAAVSDGIRNHLWNALKIAVRRWFNDTVQSIVGLAQMIVQVLQRGGIDWRKIGRFVWAAIIAALPMIVLQFLITRLLAMIVPAAGAVMLVIQGLMAAWGAISQVMAAVGAFVTFLLAVNGGGAGPLFAAALAASAVALIAFLAQFLLARLRGAAGGVAGRLRALGGRIMAFLRRVARGVGRVARRAGGAVARGARAVGRGLRRGVGRLRRAFGRTRLGRRLRAARAGRQRGRQRRASDPGAERLQRALQAIRPALRAMLGRGASSLRLRARLLLWQLRWRLRKLTLQGEQVVAGNSPDVKVEDVDRVNANELGTRLEQVLIEVEREMIADDLTNATATVQGSFDRLRSMIERGDRRAEGPRNLPRPEQYRIFRAIVQGDLRVRAQQRGRFNSAIVRPGQPGFMTYVNVRPGAGGGWQQSGSGLWVQGAGTYPLRDLEAAGRSGLVNAVEPARMAGQRPAVALTGFFRDSGLATDRQLLSPQAPLGGMTAAGSARAADVDEGRTAASPTGSLERLEEDAARLHRRAAIRNIFRRLVEVVHNAPKRFQVLPQQQQAAMQALADAFSTWFRRHFEGEKRRLRSGGNDLAPGQSAAVATRLATAIRTFLATL